MVIRELNVNKVVWSRDANRWLIQTVKHPQDFLLTFATIKVILTHGGVLFCEVIDGVPSIQWSYSTQKTYGRNVNDLLTKSDLQYQSYPLGIVRIKNWSNSARG